MQQFFYLLWQVPYLSGCELMNPLLNPILLSQVLKSYITDPNRLKRFTNEKLEKYQKIQLKKIINYAYKVPMYRDKYKKAGLHPKDIKRIEDIEKLPFITKDDMREYSPNDITSPTFNKKNAIVSRTGGTTGESLAIYFDLYTVVKGMLGFVRALKMYGVDWRKTKMTLLIDLSERSFENEYFINSIFSAIKPVVSQKNIQIFDLFDTSSDVIKKIEEFQPEFIGGYPFAFIQLALLKNKGFGKKISPRCVLSSGSYFDSYSRKFVEKILDTKIYDFYAATETGPIAFECKNGNYHVHSDLVYPEFIMNGEHVSYGKPGTLIITKLYGRGTPIIRYAGIDDLVTPGEKCNCGLSGGIIKKIHGRKCDSILLPDGKMALPSLLDNVFGETVYELKANKIRRIQIIQHKIDSLELKILFDEDLRDIGPTSEEIFSLLKRKLLEKFDSGINLVITEVDKFDKKTPYFVSKIDRAKFVEKMYLV